MTIHCTKVDKNGVVRVWTEDSITHEVIHEDIAAAEKMKAYMDKIRPTKEL